jgi:hypothetical protein
MQAAAKPVRYPIRVSVRASDELVRAIALAANRRQSSLSECLRQYVLKGLQADGVHLGPDGYVVEPVAAGGELR